MAIETTFSIIKPNAVKKNVIGPIIATFEKNGLRVAAAKLTVISRAKCEEFYAEHKARPFFGELVSFMTSGPVLLMALHGENAIAKNRDVMGATDPKKLLLAQSAQNSATALVKTLFMAAIAQQVHNVSSLCFSKKTRSLINNFVRT